MAESPGEDLSTEARGDEPGSAPVEPPPPPEPRRRWLPVRLAILALLVGGGLAAWVWHDMQQVLTRAMPTGPRPIPFDVAKGASLSQVARDLQGRGLIPVAHYLIFEARRAGQSKSLKAGEYVIEPRMTPRELLERLVAGQVVQRAMTIIEGWTFRQLLDEVRSSSTLKQTLDGLSDEEIMEQLGAPGVHPEGRFLAETYHFPAGTTDLQFLRRAYLLMEDVLAVQWAGRADDLPYEGPDDALILASIIEKETAAPEERARIAGVFVRRLRKGMRLQTDPTVIYGMGEEFDGNIRRADLRAETPYNTYVHHGLTPTPIPMPGGAAIRAALHPEPGKALFFVSRGDGRHHFSETYAEHREAVVRYQLKRRGNRRKAASEAPGSG